MCCFFMSESQRSPRKNVGSPRRVQRPPRRSRGPPVDNDFEQPQRSNQKFHSGRNVPVSRHSVQKGRRPYSRESQRNRDRPDMKQFGKSYKGPRADAEKTEDQITQIVENMKKGLSKDQPASIPVPEGLGAESTQNQVKNSPTQTSRSSAALKKELQNLFLLSKTSKSDKNVSEQKEQKQVSGEKVVFLNVEKPLALIPVKVKGKKGMKPVIDDDIQQSKTPEIAPKQELKSNSKPKKEKRQATRIDSVDPKALQAMAFLHHLALYSHGMINKQATKMDPKIQESVAAGPVPTTQATLLILHGRGSKSKSHSEVQKTNNDRKDSNYGADSGNADSGKESPDDMNASFLAAMKVLAEIVNHMNPGKTDKKSDDVENVTPGNRIEMTTPPVFMRMGHVLAEILGNNGKGDSENFHRYSNRNSNMNSEVTPKPSNMDVEESSYTKESENVNEDFGSNTNSEITPKPRSGNVEESGNISEDGDDDFGSNMNSEVTPKPYNVNEERSGDTWENVNEDFGGNVTSDIAPKPSSSNVAEDDTFPENSPELPITEKVTKLDSEDNDKPNEGSNTEPTASVTYDLNNVAGNVLDEDPLAFIERLALEGTFGESEEWGTSAAESSIAELTSSLNRTGVNYDNAGLNGVGRSSDSGTAARIMFPDFDVRSRTPGFSGASASESVINISGGADSGEPSSSSSSAGGMFADLDAKPMASVRGRTSVGANSGKPVSESINGPTSSDRSSGSNKGDESIAAEMIAKLQKAVKEEGKKRPKEMQDATPQESGDNPKDPKNPASVIKKFEKLVKKYSEQPNNDKSDDKADDEKEGISGVSDRRRSSKVKKSDTVGIRRGRHNGKEKKMDNDESSSLSAVSSKVGDVGSSQVSGLNSNGNRPNMTSSDNTIDDDDDSEGSGLGEDIEGLGARPEVVPGMIEVTGEPLLDAIKDKKKKREFQFILKRAANRRKEVMLVFFDGGYFDFALNLAKTSIIPNGISNVVFVSLDSTGCLPLRELNQWCFVTSYDNDKIEGGVASNYGDDVYWMKVNARHIYILEALLKGYKVLHVDPDVYFFKDPFPYFRNSSVDIQGMVDGISAMNIGFIYVKPTRFSIGFFSDFVRLIKHTPTLNEQGVFNMLLGMIAGNSYDFDFDYVDPKMFLNGKEYYDKPKRYFYDDHESCDSCVVVHNNHIIGKSGKIYRFKENLQWGVDTNNYYSDPSRKYIVYDNPVAIKNQDQSLKYEISALRDALAIGMILNRTLILPRFHCDNDLNITECPLNSYLLMREFDEIFYGTYRENVFLQNSLVPDIIKSNHSEVYNIDAETSLPFKLDIPNDVVKLTSQSKGKVSSEEIKNWFGSVSDSVLKIHSLYGTYIDFLDPKKDKAFNDKVMKAFRRGTYEQNPL